MVPRIAAPAPPRPPCGSFQPILAPVLRQGPVLGQLDLNGLGASHRGGGGWEVFYGNGGAKTWLDFSMQNQGFHHISAEKW